MQRSTTTLVVLTIILAIVVLVWLMRPVAAGQTCTSSTFSGVTTTVCSKPKLVCKSSTFAGVTRTRCSK